MDEPQPACLGMAPTFDRELHKETPTAREARFARAIAVCRTCPILTDCAQTVAQLPKSWQRGVWAGEVLGCAFKDAS
jgi:hypothetical protein